MRIGIKLLSTWFKPKPVVQLTLEERFAKQRNEIDEHMQIHGPDIENMVHRAMRKAKLCPESYTIKLIPPLKPKTQIKCVLFLNGYRYHRPDYDDGVLILMRWRPDACFPPCNGVYSAVAQSQLNVPYTHGNTTEAILEKLRAEFWIKVDGE